MPLHTSIATTRFTGAGQGARQYRPSCMKNSGNLIEASAQVTRGHHTTAINNTARPLLLQLDPPGLQRNGKLSEKTSQAGPRVTGYSQRTTTSKASSHCPPEAQAANQHQNQFTVWCLLRQGCKHLQASQHASILKARKML